MAKLIVSPQAALDAAAIVELLSDKAGIDVAAKYLRENRYAFRANISLSQKRHAPSVTRS